MLVTVYNSFIEISKTIIQSKLLSEPRPVSIITN